MNADFDSENVMKHADFETLLDYLDGKLPDLAGREIADHLRICETCGIEAGKLRKFMEFAETGPLEEVPQADTARLLNIYRPEKRDEKKEPARRFLASLIFDDWQTALNERFLMPDSRQMLYRAGDFEIDLRLNFLSEKCRVEGQVFPDCLAGFAEIYTDAVRHRVAFGADCEFALPPVDCGVYGLRFEIDGVTIEIQSMTLSNT